MPGRNIIKEYAADQFYHVYSRGVAKQPVFIDETDYVFFLSLFKRYLSEKPENSKRHGVYPHFGTRLQLLSYCLMSNHVHILLFQKDETAMTEFMRALMTSYGMYFNRRHKRVGPVFQSRYKASRITADPYLQHISRYIHLNPHDWRNYPYSSLPYYLGDQSADWIKPGLILNIFSNSRSDYLAFVEDYEEQKEILDELKWELADSP